MWNKERSIILVEGHFGVLFRQFFAYIDCTLVCFPLACDGLTVNIKATSRHGQTHQGNPKSRGKAFLCGGTEIAVAIQGLPWEEQTSTGPIRGDQSAA